MDQEKRIITLEKKIIAIEKRNKRVEADKAWETSWTKRIIITALTYLVIVLFFLINRLPNPYINALVPTLGFALSTLSLAFFKEIWLKKYRT